MNQPYLHNKSALYHQNYNDQNIQMHDQVHVVLENCVALYQLAKPVLVLFVKFVIENVELVVLVPIYVVILLVGQFYVFHMISSLNFKIFKIFLVI